MTLLSEPTKPASKPSWRRRLATVALAVCLLVAAGIFYLSYNLTHLARWAVQRSVPGAKVELSGATLDAFHQLTVRNLVLRDRQTGEELLHLDSGSIEFSFDDFRQATLGEVRLVNPKISVSPNLLKSLSRGGSSSSGGTWAFRRLVCDYAEISVNGFGSTVPDVTFRCAFDWKNPGATSPLELLLWEISATLPGVPAPFLSLDMVRLVASPQEVLSNRHIETLDVNGGGLLLGQALQTLFAGPPAAASSAPASWKIGTLDVKNVRVRLEDTREIASDISFVVNTSLQDVSPVGAAASIGGELQTVEIADLEILSPYDPFIKVITMRRIFLRFTLGGLLRKELGEVVILNPSVFIGQDLFWYMDDTQQRLAGAGGTPAGTIGGAGWKIARLKVEYGRLLIGSGGRAKYGLPLNFFASASDIALDDLASLQLQTTFQIPRQEYAFPDYQLNLATKRGDLQFAYPPEKQENNLVGKVFFESIQWRQFRATDAWASATFDITGVNGAFGGRIYRGYVSGGFSFLFQDRTPWIGWIPGEKVSLRELTDIIAPDNFRLTGPVDFKLQLDAFGRAIQRAKGSFRARKPGRMEIGKIDDFLANIPDAWSQLKKSSMKIALTSLRNFDYEKAEGKLWFAQGQGVLGLELQGALGSRTFDIVLHADDSGQSRWADQP